MEINSIKDIDTVAIEIFTQTGRVVWKMVDPHSWDGPIFRNNEETQDYVLCNELRGNFGSRKYVPVAVLKVEE